eukprot:2284587-Rhodomonas_salina.1
MPSPSHCHCDSAQALSFSLTRCGVESRLEPRSREVEAEARREPRRDSEAGDEGRATDRDKGSREERARAGIRVCASALRDPRQCSLASWHGRGAAVSRCDQVTAP